ncbi:MAG TPA: DUF2071 domain-containing protein [Ktedonobacteraceae bacterium]|nr:DUF2071 domain-containing protein [Ktedonobacteraceae bacterium]
MNIPDILHTVRHRTYPLPHSPWIMVQSWHELLFEHWPIAPEIMRTLVPACLEIDTFERNAWIGVVPFHMSGVRPRGIPPSPGISAFPELNVRTYVVKNGMSGVYFFSLDADNPLAVALARSLFYLPYFNARMRSRRVDDTIHYTSVRTHRNAPAAEYRARYQAIAPIVWARPGSLEAWLTERYALYTTAGSQLYRGDIHHLPWPLQMAEIEVECDTMALSHGIHLPDTAPLLHYAQRQDVLIWPLRRIPAH